MEGLGRSESPAARARTFAGLSYGSFARLLAVVVLCASPATGQQFGFVLEDVWRAPGAVRAIGFAPDGDWLVVGSGRSATVFARKGNRVLPLGDLGTFGKEVRGAAVSPGGDSIALVDGAGGLRLFAAPSLAPVARVDRAHKKRATAVAYTPDGRYVVTGGGDAKVRVWTTGGELFAELSGGSSHDKEIVFVAGVPPGRRALSVGKDRRVILWNVDTQRAIRATAVDMDVRSAALGGAGRVLALGLELLQAPLFRSQTMGSAHNIKATDTIRLIDADRGLVMRDLEGEAQEINALGLTPDGQFLASAGSEGTASVWETGSGRLVTHIPFAAPVTALAFSPDGRWMVTGTNEGEMSLYSLTGVGPAPAPAGPGQIIIVIIQPESLVSGNRGVEAATVETGSLELRGRVRTGAPLKSLQVNGREITSIVAAEEGDYLFTAFVPLETAGERAIEIVAQDQAGSVGRKSLFVERAAQVRPPPVGEGRRIALIVGVSKYNDPSVDLQYANGDAKALYELLTSAELGPAAFEPRDVMLLLDEEATVARIGIGLREFLQRAREDDFALFFFAGHGVPDPNRPQDLYLMAHDTNPRNIAGTGLLMRHVREAVAAIRARNVLILTDACHSAGMSAPKNIRSLTVNPIHRAFLDRLLHTAGGLAILTASEAAQVSLESPKWEGHGVFTYYLLQGLRGSADQDRDQIVSIGEIMEYVREKVKRDTNGMQIPSIGPTSFDRRTPIVVVPR